MFFSTVKEVWVIWDDWTEDILIGDPDETGDGTGSDRRLPTLAYSQQKLDECVVVGVLYDSHVLCQL